MDQKFEMVAKTFQGLEDVLADHLPDLDDVGPAGELEPHLSDSGHVDLQFAVQVDDPCGLHGEAGDRLVGYRGDVLLLSGDPLYVDGDEPLVGEQDVVTYGLVHSKDLLVGQEHSEDVGTDCIVLNLPHLQVLGILEIDHEYQNRLKTSSEYFNTSSMGIPAMSSAWEYMIPAMALALSLSSAYAFFSAA